MRVLAMVASYPPYQCVGSYLMTHSLLTALAARGHGVDVVLSETRGDPYGSDGVAVWPHVDKHDPSRFLDAADVIVAHVGSSGRALALAEIHQIPAVLLAHDTSAFTEAVLAKRPAALTVFNSAHMQARFGHLTGRQIVIRPPIFPAEWETTPGDAVTLINLSPDKGAHVFYGLAEKFPKVPFLGVEGGYGLQVHKRGDDDLPNTQILRHTPAGQMRDQVYARTRILLMPSAYESWGRAGVEAMCSGIPVIAHPAAGLVESLGDAGVFADRGDLAGWATALRSLLDGRKWRAASRRAKARAATFDPAADVAVWCAELEELGRRRIRVRTRVTV